jgi:hypothetical protein
MIQNYYEILGVKNDASYDDIKRAWREKAKQCHPDKFRSSVEKLNAHRKFIEITEAYAVLIDLTKRASYDSKVANAQPKCPYAGYEKASPANDQKEASDLYQEILAEPPRKFAEETFFALLLLLTCGGFGIVYPILSLLGIANDVGIGNKIVGIYFLFFSVPFSVGLLINLYYRAKRVTEWAILKARGQRIFSTDLVK